MYFNAIKSIVFICLLVMLNACGIGRYHSLNLVRPDKNTSATLVKSKLKTSNVTEVIKADSVIAQIKEEDGLTEKANIVFEKRANNLETTLIKKTTKYNEKEKSLKKYIKFKHSINRFSSKIESLPKPNHGFNYLLFFISLFCATIIVGLIVLFFNLQLGLWLILTPIAILIALCILFIIFDLIIGYL